MAENRNNNNDNQPLRDDSAHDYGYKDESRNQPDGITDTLKPPPREDRRENTDDNQRSSR